MQRLCVISNGHGEDGIALAVINALKTQHNTLDIQAMPLVGAGHAFSEQKIEIVSPNPVFPSGGFIRSLKDLCLDIKAGLIRHVLRQRRTIKTMVEQADSILAVGDIFCVWMAAQSKKPLFFMPTAKSDMFMPHSHIEIWVMRRFCTAIFTRDEQTAESLKKQGLPAHYLGNVMMDDLVTDQPIPNLNTNKPIIGILPGSRDEAYQNLAHIVKIVECLGHHYTYVLAKSPSLDVEKLSGVIGQAPIVISTAFKSVINQSQLVIGLSGTGNEQAAYIGKPVVCFEGFGPQTTKTRFLEQQKLMGKGIFFMQDNAPSAVAMFIKNYLNQGVYKTACPEPESAAKKIADWITHSLNN